MVYLSDGHTHRETAKVFKVSAGTLSTWKTQLNKTGNLAPQKCTGRWRKIDPDKLRKFVAEHPDAYQHEIAATLGLIHHAILSKHGIIKYAKKINIC